jgi:hypothetical protein
MKYLAIIAFLITAMGCSTKAQINSTWVDEDIYSKNLSGVLVVAVAENKELRILFEDDFVTELEKHGVNAIASHKVGLEKINPDNVVAVAESNGVETVLVTNYVGAIEYDVYHGDTIYYGGAMTVSSGGGGSTDYYGYSYQIDGPASYYTTNKYVHLVSTLYEVSSREMLWNTISSAQLAGDPVNLFVPFIKVLVGQAKKDNLIN